MKNIVNCLGCKNKFSFNKYRPNKKFCSLKCYRKNICLVKNNGRFKKGHKTWNTNKQLPKWLKIKLSDSRMKSIYRTGKLHPRWKGGKRGYCNNMAKKILLENKIPFKCYICKKKLKILHIHHIDRNWKNNNLKNIVFVCISCHLKIHHKEDKTKNVCQWCGKIFWSGRVARMFCNIACRSRSWVANNLEKNIAYKHNYYLKKYHNLTTHHKEEK